MSERDERPVKPPPLPSRGAERSGVMRAAPGSPVLKSGAIIAGKYRLERKISQGGMGSVWAATHLSLDTPVAIKFMTVRLADDPNASPEARNAALYEGQTRFEREARAAAQIRMANVVQILDYGIDTHGPYIVMELLEGEDLEARLFRVKRLSPAQAAKIVVPISRALQRAHELGLVHRDLKPGNIFLAREGDNEVPKILDFGVAKIVADDGKASDVTHQGIVLGTPHYMSPEQALNHRIDARSDLWSLGVILFRALTGKRPFEGGGALETVVKICTGPIPKATHANPDLPAEVDAFFARALVRDPEKRFQNAREMSQAFAQRFRGPDTSWPPPVPGPAEPGPPEPGSTSRLNPADAAGASSEQNTIEHTPLLPPAEPAPEPQVAADVVVGERDDSALGRRKRLTTGVVAAVSASSLLAVIALARIFGGSEVEPLHSAPSPPMASHTAPPPRGSAAVPETQAASAEALLAPATSASVAEPSVAPKAHRRPVTKPATKSTSTARPAAKPKPKRGRDLGY